jgi:(1->4)-alpha-D-glucan 1-alpha-D-glucosylmutase
MVRRSGIRREPVLPSTVPIVAHSAPEISAGVLRVIMKTTWRATYRLQLHEKFALSDAEGLLPYLARLGISHVYLSPCLQAVPGTSHGYDVTDPGKIRSELGGETAWRNFCAAARRHGLGVLLDFVPNHMATHAANAWWEDVLTHGPYSRYARYFDIAGETLTPRWRIGLAVLPDAYQAVLSSGEMTIALAGDYPRLELGAQSWPLAPASWSAFLPAESAARSSFDRLAGLAMMAGPDEAAREEYRALVQDALAAWRDARAEAMDALKSQAEQIVREPDRLHALLESQFYELHGWKRANEVVNYRRFFDVNGLVGVRVERDEVFNDLHGRLKAAIDAGDIQGVRIDHPDGLRNPADYGRKLRTLFPDGRIYLEKILDSSEKLRAGWPVDGTTGYDFLAAVNRLWMDPEKAEVLAGIYAEFTGHPTDLSRITRETKARIIEETFSAELERLTEIACRRAWAAWQTRDIGRRQLRQAIAAVTVSLSVYRTYREAGPVVEEDRRLLESAVASAQSMLEPGSRAAMQYVERLLLDEAADPAAAEFIARWQQLTPAVTAKGVEDTTFYCYDRLVSCNEVGAQAALLGIAAEKFHEFCHHLSVHWPHTLLATSTHDSKRSEDVRTRISVITEMPDAWRAAITEWARINRAAWSGRAPDRHAEYLLYQTLVGAHPLGFDRAWAYMLKACREAKIHTNWHRPNKEYEDTIREFLAAILVNTQFTDSLNAFAELLVGPGRINSLAQTLIKLTAPGVPDFYQGSELWDLSLVDPDNRRPVDYAARTAMLEGLADTAVADVAGEWDSGRPKLWLIARVLRLRQEHPEWFEAASSYAPVAARGARASHILGYLRSGMMLVLVPRFTALLRDDWRDTLMPLPAGVWKDWLSTRQWIGGVAPRDLFQAFPVALLVKQP